MDINSHSLLPFKNVLGTIVNRQDKYLEPPVYRIHDFCKRLNCHLLPVKVPWTDCYVALLDVIREVLNVERTWRADDGWKTRADFAVEPEVCHLHVSVQKSVHFDSEVHFLSCCSNS